MACRFTLSRDNFIRWEKIYGDYTIQELQANGLPDLCDPSDLFPPTLLTASATNTVVTLNWIDNNSFELGTEIHRSTTPNFTPSPSTLLTFVGADVTTYQYTGDAKTTYYHRVRAFGVNQTYSDFSNQAAATTTCSDWSGNLVTTRTLTPYTAASDGKWNNDGTKFYTLGTRPTFRLLSEYACSSAYSAANIALTATATQNLQSITGNQNSTGISWNSDGTKLAVCSSTDNRVSVLTFTIGFDVSSYSSVINQTLSNPSGAIGWSGVHMHPSGTSLFLVGNEDGFIRKYTMSAYDPTTLSLSQTLDISDFISTGRGIDMNSTGTAFLVCGSSGNVARFTMSAFDLDTVNFVTCYEGVAVRGVAINGDTFDKFYLTNDDTSNDFVAEYDL